jgi:hypothetical protein
VVISLIYIASAKLGSRRIVRMGLIVAAVVFAAGSFLLRYHPVPGASYGMWATAWTRDLRLCAAILDLALWAMLIASREKEPQLLMLTCALGIMFAGEAMGESIRTMAAAMSTNRHLVADIGGLVVLISDLGFLYIWWRAFRRPEPSGKAGHAARS